eukprot:1583281-Prymnesium_polylepis.1
MPSLLSGGGAGTLTAGALTAGALTAGGLTAGALTAGALTAGGAAATFWATADTVAAVAPKVGKSSFWSQARFASSSRSKTLHASSSPPSHASASATTCADTTSHASSSPPPHASPRRSRICCTRASSSCREGLHKGRPPMTMQCVGELGGLRITCDQARASGGSRVPRRACEKLARAKAALRDHAGSNPTLEEKKAFCSSRAMFATTPPAATAARTRTAVAKRSPGPMAFSHASNESGRSDAAHSVSGGIDIASATAFASTSLSTPT